MRRKKVASWRVKERSPARSAASTSHPPTAFSASGSSKPTASCPSPLPSTRIARPVPLVDCLLGPAGLSSECFSQQVREEEQVGLGPLSRLRSRDVGCCPENAANAGLPVARNLDELMAIAKEPR